MFIRISKIFTIACFVLLVAACSNEPSIKSATAEKVIIGGPPEKFTAAYELAKKECFKHTKTAEFTPDDTASLSEVAFQCVGQEVEDEAVATDESTTVDEADSEEIEADASQEIQ